MIELITCGICKQDKENVKRRTFRNIKGLTKGISITSKLELCDDCATFTDNMIPKRNI